MGFASRVAKNTSILVVTHFLTYSISILVFALLGRYLRAEGLGRFDYLSSILNIFYLLSGLGLDIMLVREIAARREKTAEYLNAVLSLKALFCLIMIVFYYSFSLFTDESVEFKKALFLGGLSIIFTSWSGSFQAVFSAHERMFYRGMTLLALNLIQLMGLVVVIIWSRGFISTIFAYHVLGSLTGLLVSAYFVRKHFSIIRPRIALSLWKEFLSRSLSFFVVQLAGIAYFRSNIIILRLLRTDQITGWFSASKRLLEAIHLVTSALTQALFPALASRFESSDEDRGELFCRMSELILLLSIPSGLFLIFGARGIIGLIYGVSGYEPSIGILRGFGLVVMVMIYDAFVTYFALVLRLERGVQKVSLVRIPLFIGMDYLLVLVGGAYGAVIATGLSSVYNLSACLYLVRHALGPLKIQAIVYRPLLVNCCFLPIIYIAAQLNLFLAMGVSGMGYAALLWGFKIVGVQELEEMGFFRYWKRLTQRSPENKAS